MKIVVIGGSGLIGSRLVIPDSHARYFGAELNDASLVAGPDARVGSMRFEQWLKDSAPQRPAS